MISRYFFLLAFLLALAAIYKGLRIYAPWAAGVTLRHMVSYGLAMRAVEIKLMSGTETEVRCLRRGTFYEQQKKDKRKSFKLVTAIAVSFVQQVFFHTQTLSLM